MAENVKHTPGPWVVHGVNLEGEHPQFYVMPFYKRLSASGVTGNHICRVNTVHGERQVEEREANARLIAAAPDLLDVLDEVYGELLADDCRDGPRCLLLTTIEKALAKATGGAQ